MADDSRRRGGPFSEGMRAVTGVLDALREAVEGTFDDLRDSGDLSADRARDAARTTMDHAQEALDDLRGRVDFVTRKELENVRTELAEVRARLDRLEGGGAATGAATAGPAGPTDSTGPGFPVDGG